MTNTESAPTRTVTLDQELIEVLWGFLVRNVNLHRLGDDEPMVRISRALYQAMEEAT